LITKLIAIKIFHQSAALLITTMKLFTFSNINSIVWRQRKTLLVH